MSFITLNPAIFFAPNYGLKTSESGSPTIGGEDALSRSLICGAERIVGPTESERLDICASLR